MQNLLSIMWSDEGQDIAEYAVMLAVILVIVIGTIRLVGSNANNAFSSVASSDPLGPEPARCSSSIGRRRRNVNAKGPRNNKFPLIGLTKTSIAAQ